MPLSKSAAPLFISFCLSLKLSNSGSAPYSYRGAAPVLFLKEWVSWHKSSTEQLNLPL
jgi:hypothetical protein